MTIHLCISFGRSKLLGVGFCWFMNWFSNFGVSLSFKVLVKALPGPGGQALIFGRSQAICGRFGA